MLGFREAQVLLDDETHPEHREAVEETFGHELLLAIAFHGEIAMKVQDEQYDQVLHSKARAILRADGDGAAHVAFVDGLRK